MGEYSATSKVVNSIEDGLIIWTDYEKKWEADAFLCWKLEKTQKLNEIEDWWTQILNTKLLNTGISIENKSLTIEQTIRKK